MKFIAHLYQQYDPWVKHPILFRKTFHPWPVEVSLRPFFIPDDLGLYNQWVNYQFNPGRRPGLPASVFSENYFQAVLASSNAQCLWGTVNDQPAFGLELYKALQYHASDDIRDIRLREGDVMMQIVPAPGIMDSHEELATYILPASLEYIAEDPASKRVFFITEEDNGFSRNLVKLARPFRRLYADKGRVIYEFRIWVPGVTSKRYNKYSS
jgi:hypothetical protein